MESPLEISVRSGWYCPGGEDVEPAEYCVLLTTGGPALRIRGDIARFGEPVSVKLEWQDWGVPWTEYPTSAADDDALLWFASLFTFVP
jgi:hypothetical protein